LVTLISFVILLGILIFVHELGHFSVARACGIGVEKFSLGFGRKIIGKKIGETEYVLSWIPLGGYVKLLGDTDTEGLSPEDEKRAFLAQPPWKRLLIVLAGPFSNFLLAVIIFSIVFVYGVPNLAPVVGIVQPGSAAQIAGITTGDRITSIDGRKINYWTQIEKIVQDSKGREITITASRGAEEQTFTARPVLSSIKNIFGKEEPLYRLGIAPMSNIVAAVGEVTEGSAAAEAGIIKGDAIISINNREITYWDEIRPAVSSSEGRELHVVVRRGEEDKGFILKPKLSREKNLIGQEVDVYLIGIQAAGSIHTVVGEIKPGTPAQKAGFLAGDKIISVTGKKVFSWEDIEKSLEHPRASAVPFEVLRAGKITTLTLEREPEIRGAVKNQTAAIGLNPETGEAIERKNPAAAVVSSLARTWEFSKLTVVVVIKMIEGVVSPRTLGGPIFIAQTAGKQAREGVVNFIIFMAVLSINLGVINLFPVPVLDGGHVLFYLYEIVTRRAVPKKVREWSTQIGFVVLLMLMLFVIMIDIERLDIKLVNDVLNFFK
jgi:regulator of sigma E protease